MSEVAEKRRDSKGESAEISPRCSHMLGDGKKCKQKAWRGKGVCYQHDPEAAELRKKAGRPSNPAAMMTVAEVQELLAEALGDLRAGRIKPGEAYAVGYLAQLALTAIGAARKARKVDVKHFWEMVDLGAAFETAAELQEERKKETEAEEAQTLGTTDEQRSEETSEEEDDSGEEAVVT